MESNPTVARPANSACAVRMPVSMMYAVTFDAVVEYVYELSSGRARWSIRYRPQVAGDWVADAVTTPSCWTEETRGSAASRWAFSADNRTAKPRTAAV